MAEKTKRSVRSPEEETFHRYYNRLLDDINSPNELARLLFADGIISSETKETVTSNTDVDQTPSLLDAVQHALENAPDPEKTFRSLLVALGTTCTRRSSVGYEMKKFNSGECTISVKTSA